MKFVKHPSFGAVLFLISLAGMWAGQPTARGATPRSLAIIGHRGAPRVAPENTLLAIARAFEAGATMVEVDVHLSRDGVPVIIHDDTLERTTNGKGPVSALSLGELKNLDAGAWMGTAFAGQRIPTLREVLEASKGRGRVLIDPKQNGMGSAIALVYREAGVPIAEAMLGTWEASQAADFAKHLKGAHILNTIDEGSPETWNDRYFDRERARGIAGFEISTRWSPDFIAAAHAHRMTVVAYTVDDVASMRAVIAAGVDGVETNDVATLVREARLLRVEASQLAPFAPRP
jgi:glycerophosphoryl diester phosphodiesterase